MKKRQIVPTTVRLVSAVALPSARETSGFEVTKTEADRFHAFRLHHGLTDFGYHVELFAGRWFASTPYAQGVIRGWREGGRIFINTTAGTLEEVVERLLELPASIARACALASLKRNDIDARLGAEARHDAERDVFVFADSSELRVCSEGLYL